MTTAARSVASKAPQTAAKSATATLKPITATKPITTVATQAPAAVRLGDVARNPQVRGAIAEVRGGGGGATPELDLSSGTIALSPQAAATVGDKGDIKVRLPGLAQGTIPVEKTGDVYGIRGQHAIQLTLPALASYPVGANTVLVLKGEKGRVTGFVGHGKPGAGSRPDLFNAIARAVTLMNWVGFDRVRLGSVQNKFENGVLSLSAQGFGFLLGGFVEGTGNFSIQDKALSFDASARINILGAGGELQIQQDANGLSGSAQLDVTFKQFTGKVLAQLDQGFVSIQGTVGYAGDKLSGSVTLIATDKATARDITTKEPEPGQLPSASAAKSNKPGKRALCGWGQLSFTLTDWLAGNVMVIVNSEGKVTAKGSIAPPAQIVLFEQKDWVKNLFTLEVRAPYGIPVVGNVFVFASIGLDAMATIGPGVLKDIKLGGTYSTDSRVPKELKLEGTLNISAFAGLRLIAKGGVGIQILAHDIKGGVGIWALAGVRGYVEATPVIGYREKGPRGEYSIKGHMDIAAQLFLGLGGDLYIEIASPWWSPVPNKKWTWPLGQIEYPLGEFGIGADVDYILGSKSWPQIQFSPASFDSSKFMTDLLSDKPPGKGGKKEDNKKGNWGEGNKGAGAGPGPKGKGKQGSGAPSKGKPPKTKGAPGGRRGPATPGALTLYTGPIGESVPFSAAKESHRLWIDEQGNRAAPVVASPGGSPVEKQLSKWEGQLGKLEARDQSKAARWIAAARTQAGKITGEASQLEALKHGAATAAQRAGNTKKGNGDTGGPQKLNQDVKSDEHKLANTLGLLFGVFGAGGNTTKSEPPGATVQVPVVMKGKSHQLKVGLDNHVKMASNEEGFFGSKVTAAINKVKKEDPPEDHRDERLQALNELSAEATSVDKALLNLQRPVERASRLGKLVNLLQNYAVKYNAKDLDDLAAAYPSPLVGTYAAMKSQAEGEKLPDGTTRVAHHVPPVALAKYLGAAMIQGVTFAKENKIEVPVELQEAGIRLQRAAEQGHGENLPTILIHVRTHSSSDPTHSNSVPGFISVHSIGIRDRLMEELDKRGVRLSARLIRADRELSVNPGKRAFERQQENVAAAMFAGQKVTVAEAMARESKALVKRTYEGAKKQAQAAVRAALGASSLDGSQSKHAGALSSLGELIAKTWKPILARFLQ